MQTWFTIIFYTTESDLKGTATLNGSESEMQVLIKPCNLPQSASGAVRRDFRTNIRRYTSPNEKFEYG